MTLDLPTKRRTLTRAEHVKEAHDLIDLAEQIRKSTEYATDAEREFSQKERAIVLQEAQVHATLATVKTATDCC